MIVDTHGRGDRGVAAGASRSTGEKVRRRFEQRFSATRMAKDYVGVYRSLLESSKSVGRASSGYPAPLGNGKDALILRPSIA